MMTVLFFGFPFVQYYFYVYIRFQVDLTVPRLSVVKLVVEDDF